MMVNLGQRVKDFEQQRAELTQAKDELSAKVGDALATAPAPAPAP